MDAVWQRWICLAAVAGLLACAALLLVVARPVWAAPSDPSAVSRDYPGASPCDTTLQAGIVGADPGDTIVIQPNTCITSVTLGNAVSLTGVASNTVILQALPDQRVLTVTGAAISNTVVISGLTFTGGDVTGTDACPANCGRGLLLVDNAQPLLVNVIIGGNQASRGGGLFAFSGSPVMMTGSQVLSNTADYGAGVTAYGPVVLQGGLFQSNVCALAGC